VRKTILALTVIAAAIAAPAVQAQNKPIKNVGITLGSLGNPFFVSLSKGAEAKVKQLNPGAKVTTLSADYELNKQFSQIDGFIAAGTDLILVNAVDAKAIEPALVKAKKAGIVVVGVDVAANGADATVQTNNVQAGEIACQFIVEKLGGKGNVIIQNGPQVSAVIDRVNGCKSVFKKNPDIKVLSDDQDAKGSREGGLNVMQNHLTRFPKIDAVFAINDPQAVGIDLAARQLKRKGIVIASVDGAPDIETALKGDTQVQASASQDPYAIAQKAVEIGQEIINGKKPANAMTLLPSTLITRDNVKDYKGWSAPR
jgi:ribose transport system substrate-binding protein